MVLEIPIRPSEAATIHTRTVAEALELARDAQVAIVDLRFTDLPGTWQHFSIPTHDLDEALFSEGIGFDGSSIRGFQAIHESDMALFPDPTTAYVDPFRAEKTLVVNFFIHDPLTGEAYSRDPRNIARKAQAYLKSTGIGDTAYFAPEAEFYMFDSVKFETKQNVGMYEIDWVARRRYWSPELRALLRVPDDLDINTDADLLERIIPNDMRGTFREKMRASLDPDGGGDYEDEHRIMRFDGTTGWILLRGKTLYVVQNQDNQITVIKLRHDLSSGRVTGVIKDGRFDVPTTIAGFGPWLYAVNARFLASPKPTDPYTVVRVRAH